MEEKTNLKNQPSESQEQEPGSVLVLLIWVSVPFVIAKAIPAIRGILFPAKVSRKSDTRIVRGTEQRPYNLDSSVDNQNSFEVVTCPPTRVPRAKMGDILDRSNNTVNRVGQVEPQFSYGVMTDQLTTIRDIVLVKDVEHLSETVKRLESKTLSEWAVAKITISLLTALGAALAILQFIMQF